LPIFDTAASSVETNVVAVMPLSASIVAAHAASSATSALNCTVSCRRSLPCAVLTLLLVTGTAMGVS
jgi:hypothetical protein